jgi:hypothetical protein
MRLVSAAIGASFSFSLLRTLVHAGFRVFPQSCDLRTFDSTCQTKKQTSKSKKKKSKSIVKHTNKGTNKQTQKKKKFVKVRAQRTVPMRRTVNPSSSAVSSMHAISGVLSEYSGNGISVISQSLLNSLNQKESLHYTSRCQTSSCSCLETALLFPAGDKSMNILTINEVISLPSKIRATYFYAQVKFDKNEWCYKKKIIKK